VQEASASVLLKKINEIEGLLMGPHGLDEITAKVPTQLLFNTTAFSFAFSVRHYSSRCQPLRWATSSKIVVVCRVGRAVLMPVENIVKIACLLLLFLILCANAYVCFTYITQYDTMHNIT
jgi:hypothetical protein